MKQIAKLVTLVLALLCMGKAAAATLPDKETLRYNVSYKWGVIQKNAGTAVLKLSRSGDSYKAALYGRTDPWADKFFSVRDTLLSTFSASTYIPTLYHRIAHEDGAYAHDIVKFNTSGSIVSATTTVFRRGKKDTETTKKGFNLSAQGMTVDLLSSFYYLRSMDFSSMAPGTTQRVNIFSGKKKELLTITYCGISRLKLNGRDYETFHIKFTFTSDGQKESSAPIDAWISTDSNRVPLKIEGSLKIGKVRCIIANK